AARTTSWSGWAARMRRCGRSSASAKVWRKPDMASNDYLHQDKTASFLDRKLWVRLLGLAKDHKWLAIGALLLLLVAEVMPLLQPRVLRSMIDGPIAARDLDGI